MAAATPTRPRLNKRGHRVAPLIRGIAVGAAVIGIWVLGSIIPSIAVQVRRFHDQDRSGWMILLGFIPYVGTFIVIIFMCLKGTTGPNRFGPDPLDPSSVDVFA